MTLPEKWIQRICTECDGDDSTCKTCNGTSFELFPSREYVKAIEEFAKRAAEAIIRNWPEDNGSYPAFCIFCYDEDVEYVGQGKYHTSHTPDCIVLAAQEFQKQVKE